jgi:hypothetical protein
MSKVDLRNPTEALKTGRGVIDSNSSCIQINIIHRRRVSCVLRYPLVNMGIVWICDRIYITNPINIFLEGIQNCV